MPCEAWLCRAHGGKSCSCRLDVPRQPGPRSSCLPAAELNWGCKTSSHGALPFQLPSRAGQRWNPKHSQCCVSPGRSQMLSSLCWLVVWAGKPSLHVTQAAARQAASSQAVPGLTRLSSGCGIAVGGQAQLAIGSHRIVLLSRAWGNRGTDGTSTLKSVRQELGMNSSTLTILPLSPGSFPDPRTDPRSPQARPPPAPCNSPMSLLAPSPHLPASLGHSFGYSLCLVPGCTHV